MKEKSEKTDEAIRRMIRDRLKDYTKKELEEILRLLKSKKKKS
jgi:hypothetical protein